MKSISLIYGSDTGMTEDVTHTILEYIDWAEVKVTEVNKVSKSDFEDFEFIMLGLSTWYDGDLQSDWEAYFDEFKTLDFTNKKVALYGLGDQYGYDDYFIDGVGILAEVILKNGGQIFGRWPIQGYDFSESKAYIEDEEQFIGLALDEDNQPELTNKRIEDWTKQLEKEWSLVVY